jgi:mortality factor 4-like protein 1
VPEERVLKFNEENIAKQKQLNEIQRAKDRAEREAQAERDRQIKNAKRLSGTADTSSRVTKRGGRDSLAEVRSHLHARPSARLGVCNFFFLTLKCFVRRKSF